MPVPHFLRRRARQDFPECVSGLKLKTIPSFYIPKIIEKMDVLTICHCQRVCKLLAWASGWLNPRHNVIARPSIMKVLLGSQISRFIVITPRCKIENQVNEDTTIFEDPKDVERFIKTWKLISFNLIVVERSDLQPIENIENLLENQQVFGRNFDCRDNISKENILQMCSFDHFVGYINPEIYNGGLKEFLQLPTISKARELSLNLELDDRYPEHFICCYFLFKTFETVKLIFQYPVDTFMFTQTLERIVSTNTKLNALRSLELQCPGADLVPIDFPGAMKVFESSEPDSRGRTGKCAIYYFRNETQIVTIEMISRYWNNIVFHVRLCDTMADLFENIWSIFQNIHERAEYKDIAHFKSEFVEMETIAELKDMIKRMEKTMRELEDDGIINLEQA